MNITPELTAKAKGAASAEELLALAKEHGIELTAEEAEKYFTKLTANNGELSDEELENVAGGGCGGGGGGGEEEERTTGFYYVAGDYVKFRHKGYLGEYMVYEGTVLGKRRVLEKGMEVQIEYYDDDSVWGSIYTARQVWVDYDDVLGYATKRF